jgi:hypothetical protein
MTLTEQLDSLYTTTWNIMRPKAIDAIFNATPFWYWLYSKERVRRETGARWIGQPIMYAKNNTVQSLGPGGTVNIGNTDPLTTAQFNYKYIAGSVVRLFSDDTTNVGKNQIMSLAQAKLKNLELSMVDKFESMLFGDGSGNGALDFDGLLNLVSKTPTVGTVGGIDRSSALWWQNQLRTWSVTALPTGDNPVAFNFRILYNQCSIGNDHPTLILTHSAVYEWYEAGLTTFMRIYDPRMGDAGFEALQYMGCALTFSPSCPALTAYMLNERYLELVIDTNADFMMTDWKPIPNQLDRVAQVVTKGNLTITNSRMQGVLADIVIA